MTRSIADFPLKKSRDLRSAMARTLTEYLGTLEFSFPFSRSPHRLAAVYEEWAEFERRALSTGGLLPAAAVLPDRPLPEADALTPRMLEETWNGRDTGIGHALFVLAEKVVPFVVVVRAISKPQRSAIVSAFEDAFVELGIDPLKGYPEPVRWGRVLILRDYFDRPCRYTFEGHTLLGDATTAKENRWLVQFELRAEAKQCKVGRVPAMDVRVQTVVDDEAAPR